MNLGDASGSLWINSPEITLDTPSRKALTGLHQLMGGELFG